MAYIKVLNPAGEWVDMLDGVTDGADTIEGNIGGDHIFAGGGDDFIKGGGGADFLSGGEGVDTASYADSTQGVTVNLATNVNKGGTAEGDFLIGIEDVVGSKHDDKLTGNGADNMLDGGSGHDVLKGGGGADTLKGGKGHDVLNGGDGDDTITGGDGGDTLFGGNGQDTFVFKEHDDSLMGNPTVFMDKILDFQQGADKIDLTGMDPSSGDLLILNGQNIDGVNYTFVGLDSDGNGDFTLYEFAIAVKMDPGTTLSAADVLI
jgi:Ca2+-binding RTX toxin-like protein